MTWGPRLLLLATLVGSVAVAYGPHLRTAQFVYEDASWLGSGPTTSLPRSLTRVLWNTFRTPGSAHALNLAVHIVNVGLLWLLVQRLGLSELGAWIVAGVWLLHPLTIEAVGYAAQRGELIAAAGVLGACLVATTWLSDGWQAMGVAACLILGLAGKESAVVGLLLAPLTAWQTQRRLTLASSSVILLSTIVLWVGPVSLMHLGWESVVQTNAWAWLTVQTTAVVRLTLFTFGIGVSSPDFDYSGASTWNILGVGGLAILASWQVVRHALVGYGLAWLLLSLLPRFIVQIPKSPLAEHQFYLPMVGLLIAVVSVTEPRVLDYRVSDPAPNPIEKPPPNFFVACWQVLKFLFTKRKST